MRPKLQALIRRKEIPDNLWTNCSQCSHMLFQRDFGANLYVCHNCQHHMRMPAKERIAMLLDEGYETHEIGRVLVDPLKFRDTKRYTDRLKDYRHRTGHDDAIIVASGHIMGQPVVLAVFSFDFMGGSMGLAVGQGLVLAGEQALQKRAAFIAIPSSGGARMQEGILSLMQMPRSIIAAERVKEAGLPYITCLTDPTTGGVSASFAMLGDITLAEPGATIGFTGARVIEETIRQKLPEGFQTSEYLLEHGMIDAIVPRHKSRETFGALLKLLQQKGSYVAR
ncbi:MAG: acetyl-CoA carboxylase, carboxyltransferase subunit beta [Alphaproteobacteria bacterium]